MPKSHRPQPLIPMPWTPRHLQHNLVDVLKSRFLQQRPKLLLDMIIIPPLLRPFLQQIQPPKHHVGLPPDRGRAHRLRPQRQLGQLDPATRLHGAIGLGQGGGEIANGEEHEADVDEVERVRAVQPVELEVVDLEAQVRRHPLGLDGRDVGADDFGAGIQVCHLHGPDAGAGAEVEDLLGRWGEGREVEPSARHQHHLVVFHVFAVELGFVVGEQVAAAAVGVVAAAIVPVVVFGFAEDAAEEAGAGGGGKR